MTQEQKQTLLNLGKKLISDLTTELNNELAKINTISTMEDNNNAIVNCDGTLAKIKSRLDQLKSMVQ